MSKRTASPGYPTPVLARVRRCTAAAALLLVLIALAAACGSDPTPTPTPTPTATATPAPTATPTPLPPTPTPLPPTPTPSPTPLTRVDPGEFAITDSTTGADVMALLSESEATCVEAEMDQEAVQALLGAPLLENLDLLDSFPIECLETGKATVLTIALLDAQAGGLSAGTKACIGALYAENPAMLSSEEVDTPEAVAFGLEYFLCLSDEEAAALPGPTNGEAMPFKPSGLRCVVEEAGGVEALAPLMGADSGTPPDPAVLFALMASFNACGIDLTEMGQ